MLLAYSVFVGAGAVLGTLLALAGSGLAEAPLVDGQAEAGELKIARALVVFAALGPGAAMLRLPREERWAVAAPAPLAFGTALLITSAYLLARAQPLVAAAEARERYGTPGPGLLGLAAALIVAALFARRPRTRA